MNKIVTIILVFFAITLLSFGIFHFGSNRSDGSDTKQVCGVMQNSWHECSYKCRTTFYFAAITDPDGRTTICHISKLDYGTKQAGDEVCGLVCNK